MIIEFQKKKYVLTFDDMLMMRTMNPMMSQIPYRHIHVCAAHLFALLSHPPKHFRSYEFVLAFVFLTFLRFLIHWTRVVVT